MAKNKGNDLTSLFKADIGHFEGVSEAQMDEFEKVVDETAERLAGADYVTTNRIMTEVLNNKDIRGILGKTLMVHLRKAILDRLALRKKAVESRNKALHPDGIITRIRKKLNKI